MPEKLENLYFILVLCNTKQYNLNAAPTPLIFSRPTVLPDILTADHQVDSVNLKLEDVISDGCGVGKK